MKVLRDYATDFERYAFLRDLLDTNETLFYRLLTDNLEELLPLVYTPTVGEGCERFSEIWRKPRGIFLSYPNRERLDEILANPLFDKVRVIVVSDGERILGLGDQGAGGMGIPSASCRSTLAARHPSWRDVCRSCSTWEPTIRTASPIRSMSAGGTSASAAQDYDDVRRGVSSGPSSANVGRTCCCSGRISPGPTPAVSSTATATGSARSTTTSRARRRSRPAP